MDIRDLRMGTTAWFPVFVDGALFACGDCHSGQGNGELCGTGIESPMTVTLKFNVRKDISVKEVEFQTPSPLSKSDKGAGYHVTTANGPDLMENSKNAARYMIDWIVKTLRHHPQPGLHSVQRRSGPEDQRDRRRSQFHRLGLHADGNIQELI